MAEWKVIIKNHFKSYTLFFLRNKTRRSMGRNNLFFPLPVPFLKVLCRIIRTLGRYKTTFTWKCHYKKPHCLLLNWSGCSTQENPGAINNTPGQSMAPWKMTKRRKCPFCWAPDEAIFTYFQYRAFSSRVTASQFKVLGFTKRHSNRQLLWVMQQNA